MKKIRISAVLVFMFFQYVSLGQSTGTIEIELTVKSVSEGTYFVALFNDKDGFPSSFDKAISVQKIKAESGLGNVLFSGLEHENYAVAVYLDRNENGSLDTNFFGIPKEPTGASNNVKPSFRTPSFEESSFKLDKSSLKLSIRLD